MPMYDPKKEDEHPTCVQLINEISKLFHDEVRRDKETVKFTPTYRSILRIVSQEAGLSQLTIADRIQLAPPTISITLKKMEKEGLVRRKIDNHDLRQMMVYLTEKGKRAAEAMRQQADNIDQRIMQALTDEERDTIYPILLRMRDTIADNGRRR